MRVKMSKQPAPTASAVGPCPTVIQIVGRPGTGSLSSTFAPPPISLWKTARYRLKQFQRAVKLKTKNNMMMWPKLAQKDVMLLQYYFYFSCLRKLKHYAKISYVFIIPFTLYRFSS